MAKKALKTRSSNLPVPQTRDAAAQAIFDVGTLDRELQRIDADLKDELAAVKRRFEERAQPLQEQRTALLEGLKVFCEGRRDELTDGGKSKTAMFTTGLVQWRLRPPSVKISGGEDNLVSWLIAQGGERAETFIRVKHEANRQAMLDNPALAAELPGVKISSEGEDFEVKPFVPEGLVAVQS